MGSKPPSVCPMGEARAWGPLAGAIHEDCDLSHFWVFIRCVWFSLSGGRCCPGRCISCAQGGPGLYVMLVAVYFVCSGARGRGCPFQVRGSAALVFHPCLRRLWTRFGGIGLGQFRGAVTSVTSCGVSTIP